MANTNTNQLNPNTLGNLSQSSNFSLQTRLLKSPSHESVTTDLSLFSVSSITSKDLISSDALSRGMRLINFKTPFNLDKQSTTSLNRGLSPNPENRKFLNSKHDDIPEIIWFEEENDLIKSCAALSSALGLQKSFSTSDISNIEADLDKKDDYYSYRNAISELALNLLQRSSFIIDHPKLEHASRSCSTWVAVGDVVSTSQLPSPHGDLSTSIPAASNLAVCAPSTIPSFTAADLIRSVNKKVRQNYIRRRLLTTYKALERLSQSEFNLDRLEIIAANATKHSNQQNATKKFDTPIINIEQPTVIDGNDTVKEVVEKVDKIDLASDKQIQQSQYIQTAVLMSYVNKTKNTPLTLKDVEGQRGKPLTKYERNMMIFNWLHTLDENSCEEMP